MKILSSQVSIAESHSRLQQQQQKQIFILTIVCLSVCQSVFVSVNM
jgi:hypothetical protein